MPRIFIAECTECEARVGGLTDMLLFQRKDGSWEPLTHPGEFFRVDDILDEENIPLDRRQEAISTRYGGAQVCICEGCGERIFQTTEDTWAPANNFIGSTQCKCGCKDFFPVSTLGSTTPRSCPKCKKGHLVGGCVGMS